MKAILHEPTEALKINRHIHLNPVRIAALGGHETRDVAAHEITAQLARRRVDALEQYHWSSYPFFAGTRAAPAWLCTESILAFFGPGSPCELQKAYRQQLREAAAAVEKLSLDGVSVDGVYVTFSPQFEHIWLESKKLPKFV